jgi:hypothetical protein
MDLRTANVDMVKGTVEHYLLECRNYKEPRKKLGEAVGPGKMKVGILPGEIKHTDGVYQRNRKIQLKDVTYINTKMGHSGSAKRRK